MSDYIGKIPVPEIAPSGTFPIVPDYPHGRAQRPEVVIHQFGSGNAKIEQRYLLGTGARRFTVRRAWLRDSERIALRNFWESKYGPYGAFTYNAPNDDGIGTTPYTCRFANEPLSWEMVADWACSVGVTLVEVPTTTPAYTLNSTVTRFPSQALKDALLSQVQQVIPLVKIQPLQVSYPAIHLSDRRCTIGGQLYQARLIDFDGISQGMGNEADDASFTFGNADRVMRDLANDVDLYRASIEFSLFHVGTGIRLDLWKGDIVNWSLDAGPEFKVTASDGLYELNLPYSVAVYDIDHAALIGGGAGPLYLKSNVNLCGTSTKSQAARIVSVRLREELGGTSAAEWKDARVLNFRTTVLALNTEPGMVCSMTHPDMPGGSGEFRVTSWRLNKDFSIDIQGRTTTDSMYDLVAGPKPADVEPSPVPEEILYDTGAPGIVTGTPKLGDYGTIALDDIQIAPDASGNLNLVSAHEVAMALYYVDELATDLWASLDAPIDKDTDPVTVACTVNPATARVFRVGDFIVFNDEAADPDHPGRRSYECAQIVGPGNEGDVVPSGSFVLQRAYPGVDPGFATFGTFRCAHAKGIRFFKLDYKIFTYSVKKGFFRTPGIPARVEAQLPSACVVAMLVGVANNFGYSPFTVWPLSHHNEPFMPGDRTCNGGAYTFQIPGPLAVQDTVVIPMRVHDSASIRCIFAYVQTPTLDGQSAYLVKYSRDDGATWQPLEYMGIAQMIPGGARNTYDFLVQNKGYGKPQTRRLPYNDFGIVLVDPVTASSAPQAVRWASYGANRMGVDVGEFVHINLEGANEEYVYVVAADNQNQTFTAVFTKDHEFAERVRPTIWPTPVLNEGDSLAFDILSVASPDPGADLTVVIQT